MKSKLAALSMALAVGLVSGCGGGGGDGTTQASGGSSGTASPAAPGTTPSTPVTPVTPPTTTNPPATVTELQTTKALLKSALADGGAPTTMTSPPIITAGTANMPSTIKDSTLVPPNDPSLRYIGAMETAGTAIPDNQLVKNTAVNYGGLGRDSNVYYIEFVTDAPTFEILVKGNYQISAHRILVDGQYASTTPVAYPDDGNLYLTRVDFQGARKSRKIRIETPNMRFGGLRIAPGDSVTAPPVVPKVRAVILGDSVTEGMAGLGYSFDNYAAKLGYLVGWNDMYQSGVGSTGYLAAPAPKLKFRDRVATDVYPFKPHVVVIAGGLNDACTSTDEFKAEATALFDDVQKNLPNTVVFVVGPWSPGCELQAHQDAIKAAVGTRANFYFIDNMGEQWLTGTGNVANPKGDGNSDIYISADGVHPTAAGHIYLAGKMADAVRKVVNTF
ncbi:SGNH/GDSL hydrolase family protein [Cupriavidus metallidurans]|uniref:SGNH/GDSL hydrolase family protein n=1 Tax=Cupriavidus metallidurans TaxID=119219 RepID=UPI001CC96AB2|nr:SGNH/GDSL hydrolase family protein [Cupriavidus metallidurans]UBM08364.1 SGNH/GDSL hydrolase family protein [Cupriavidus metallidurans]